MKNLLLAILLSMSINVKSQDFSLQTSVGYGLSINSKLEYSLFQSTIAVEEKFRINQVILGAKSIAVKSDSTTTLFNGGTAGYGWKIDQDKAVQVNSHFLLGFEGDFIWGGGISYDSGPVGFDLTLSQEYNRKEFWMIGGVRYSIIPY